MHPWSRLASGDGEAPGSGFIRNCGRPGGWNHVDRRSPFVKSDRTRNGSASPRSAPDEALEIGARARARSGGSTRCGLIGHSFPHLGNVAQFAENRGFSGHSAVGAARARKRATCDRSRCSLDVLMDRARRGDMAALRLPWARSSTWWLVSSSMTMASRRLSRISPARRADQRKLLPAAASTHRGLTLSPPPIAAVIQEPIRQKGHLSDLA